MGMEPSGRYGQNEEDTSSQPYWMKTPVMIAMQVGPMILIGLIFIPVVLGWIPSPMLDAIQRANELHVDMKTLYTEVAKTQTAVAATQKATADAATARDSRMEALQLKLEALAKGNRMQCRSMAKLLKNPDMNEKCDEL